MDDFERSAALAIERRGIDGAGRRVQRHVEEQRSTARGQRAASRRGAFPFRAARLVEVQVDVDQPGKHVQSARVDFFSRSWELRADRYNLAVFNRDVLACRLAPPGQA